MPKKKITLEEAFAVFEQHGLEVEVKAITPEKKRESLSAFLESSEPEPAIAVEGAKHIKITLHATHSIGTAGEIVMINGIQTPINNGVETYGPGVITVPAHLAQHLLHQDLLARRADERMLENRVRSYVVHPMRTSHGVVNVARHVSNDNAFNLSGYLGSLDSNSMYHM